MAKKRTIFETETVADLYLKQGFKDKAIVIYERLFQREPNNDRLRRKLARLKPDSPALVQTSSQEDRHHRLRILEELRQRVLTRKRN